MDYRTHFSALPWERLVYILEEQAGTNAESEAAALAELAAREVPAEQVAAERERARAKLKRAATSPDVGAQLHIGRETLMARVARYLFPERAAGSGERGRLVFVYFVLLLCLVVECSALAYLVSQPSYSLDDFDLWTTVVVVGQVGFACLLAIALRDMRKLEKRAWICAVAYAGVQTLLGILSVAVAAYSFFEVEIVYYAADGVAYWMSIVLKYSLIVFRAAVLYFLTRSGMRTLFERSTHADDELIDHLH